MADPAPPLLSSILAAALLPAAAAQGAGSDPRLEEARGLLGRPAEPDVRRGAELCATVDNPAAVELLLEVLHLETQRSRQHLPPGHYRDLVWDSLIAIRDPYARARVEEEARTTDEPFVRQWCIEALGIYGEATFARTVIRALRDKDEGVVRWAARSCGMIGEPSAVSSLAKLRSARSPYIRANAIEALARIAPDKWSQDYLLAIENDKDGGVRCALLGAATEVAPDQVERLSAAALDDEDWRPRLRAVEHLGDIKTKTAVDALILALRDGRPVVADRAQRKLQKLTGEPIQQYEVWPKWWADHRETFEFPEGDGKVAGNEEGRTETYNDIPLTSDHVAFLVDRSYAMGQTLSSKGVTKEQAAIDELERVLERLQGNLVFNVFTYHEEVAGLAKKPVDLSARWLKRAPAFVRDQRVGQRKDIWQALETVLADPTLDTAYLLSSGEPDTGTYVHWNRVTRHLRDLNRFHMVTVHTIAYSDNDWYREQLQKIAECTGGEFRWFE